MEFLVRQPEIYGGPIDLLVHLVREEEIDVREVALARLCEEFVERLRALAPEDLDAAGDALVAAATLLLLKARALLPREEVDLERDLVAGDGLLEGLLEYRRFRELARALEARAAERAARFPRGAFEAEAEPAEFEWADLDLFDVASTYARLLRETLLDRSHAVFGTIRPLRAFAREILDRLGPLRRAAFRDLLGSADDRISLVGLFAALLEMMKQGIVRARQERIEDPIEIELAASPETTERLFEAAFPLGTTPLAPVAAEGDGS